MSEDRLLATFLDLVRIDSPSGHEAEVAAYCSRALKEAGATVTFDDSAGATGSDTGNLVAVLPGTAPGLELVFSAHMDTVEPGRGVEPVLQDGVVRSAGDTVLGADDKCGVAVILEVIRRLAECDRPRVPVKVVLSVTEEVGLKGAKALDPAAAHGDLCLVLDGDGPVGGIVVGSPTHWTFSARFAGRAAHAGVNPEKGTSAVAMAATAVAAMRLGRLDEVSTANIGSMHGGRATNIVPEECIVTGECRSIHTDRVEEVRADMEAAMRRAAENAGGQVSVVWTKEYDGFQYPEDHPLVRLAEDALRDVGVDPRVYLTGGGSDANVFVGHGVPALVLASGMSDVHNAAESLEVAQMALLADVLVAVAARAVRSE